MCFLFLNMIFNISGTYDFFGLNHYTTRICEPISEATKHMMIHPDLDVLVQPNPEWDRAGISINIMCTAWYTLWLRHRYRCGRSGVRLSGQLYQIQCRQWLFSASSFLRSAKLCCSGAELHRCVTPFGVITRV